MVRSFHPVRAEYRRALGAHYSRAAQRGSARRRPPTRAPTRWARSEASGEMAIETRSLAELAAAANGVTLRSPSETPTSSRLSGSAKPRPPPQQQPSPAAATAATRHSAEAWDGAPPSASLQGSYLSPPVADAEPAKRKQRPEPKQSWVEARPSKPAAPSAGVLSGLALAISRSASRLFGAPRSTPSAAPPPEMPHLPGSAPGSGGGRQVGALELLQGLHDLLPALQPLQGYRSAHGSSPRLSNGLPTNEELEEYEREHARFEKLDAAVGLLDDASEGAWARTLEFDEIKIATLDGGGGAAPPPTPPPDAVASASGPPGAVAPQQAAPRADALLAPANALRFPRFPVGGDPSPSATPPSAALSPAAAAAAAARAAISDANDAAAARAGARLRAHIRAQTRARAAAAAAAANTANAGTHAHAHAHAHADTKAEAEAGRALRRPASWSPPLAPGREYALWRARAARGEWLTAAGLPATSKPRSLTGPSDVREVRVALRCTRGGARVATSRIQPCARRCASRSSSTAPRRAWQWHANNSTRGTACTKCRRRCRRRRRRRRNLTCRPRRHRRRAARRLENWSCGGRGPAAAVAAAASLRCGPALPPARRRQRRWLRARLELGWRDASVAYMGWWRRRRRRRGQKSW